jgi:peptidoglycan/xylan/chitin deacetylase (PgdA/CDA1 family)
LTPRRRPRAPLVVLAAVLASAGVLLAGCDAVQKAFDGAKASPSPAASVAAASPSPSATPAVSVADLPFEKTSFVEMNGRSQDARVPVIMYHDIVAEKGGKGGVYFDVSAAEFKEQMEWLAAQGATAISLEQLHRHLVHGEPVPPNAVVLTFDDNYQGFYDNALPVLKEKNWPAAVFVHTKYVGDKSGAHPKMDWETLKALDSEGLVTIASHTVTHPDDITKLAPSQIDEEMTQSKSELEGQLGHPVPYFAYPVGKNDETVRDAARRAGYTMAFTMDNGPVEQSPNVLALNRYISTKLEQAWKDCQDATVNAPATVISKEITPNTVSLEVREFDGIKLGLVRGGQPTTIRSDETGRKSVGEFIQTVGGTAVAGMNGTFFANALLRGSDNVMIGPVRTAAEGAFVPETEPSRLPRLLNRPFVVFGPGKLMIVPFQPGYMNDETAVQALMPDYTDCFLAGAWLVHGGMARTNEEMQPYAVGDFKDPRRRAFFGVTSTGDVVLGGSLEVITTEQLARAAAAAGVEEAVLVDSGFSTSVVYDNKIIVTGHTAKNLPSRPVPHAIVVTGALNPPADPETTAALAEAEPAVGAIPASQAQAEAPGPSRRRRRRN